MGGLTLYESYDESWNIIISTPYLDQYANDTIHRDGLIELDGCVHGLKRDRVVKKRAGVLRKKKKINPPMNEFDALLSPALDGPYAQDVHTLLEPTGAIILQGVHISMIVFAAERQ